MSHWHLTIAETAFLTPFGVILGAAVAYVASRRSAKDNLKAQEQLIEANRQLAEQVRIADLQREARDRRRESYLNLGGQLQAINDVLNWVVGPILQTSGLDESHWDAAEPITTWGALYAQVLDAMPDCRRAAAVDGTAEVRACVGALGSLVRTLEPPQRFSDGSGYWVHQLTKRDGGIQASLETIGPDTPLYRIAFTNIELLHEIVNFGLARIRHEQHPGEEPRPEPPVGLNVNRVM